MRARMDTTRAGLNVLVRVADLERALKLLPAKYREVVYWHGLLGLSQDETGRILQISHQAVGKRYRQALEELTYLMNGGL